MHRFILFFHAQTLPESHPIVFDGTDHHIQFPAEIDAEFLFARRWQQAVPDGIFDRGCIISEGMSVSSGCQVFGYINTAGKRLIETKLLHLQVGLQVVGISFSVTRFFSNDSMSSGSWKRTYGVARCLIIIAPSIIRLMLFQRIEYKMGIHLPAGPTVSPQPAVR